MFPFIAIKSKLKLMSIVGMCLEIVVSRGDSQDPGQAYNLSGYRHYRGDAETPTPDVHTIPFIDIREGMTHLVAALAISRFGNSTLSVPSAVP